MCCRAAAPSFPPFSFRGCRPTALCLPGLFPNREKARADLFAELTSVNTTLVFYETAPRLTKTLTAAGGIFPRGGNWAVAREMTKMFEECVNGGAEELIAHFTQNPPKGEIVLMVAPPAAENKENIDLNGVLKELMKNMPLKSGGKRSGQNLWFEQKRGLPPRGGN